jgi:hypothetical protein
MLYMVHRSSHRDVPGGPGLLPGPLPPQALQCYLTTSTKSQCRQLPRRLVLIITRKREKLFFPFFKTYEEKPITSEPLQTTSDADHL